jgi:hypothetical protein
MARGRVQFDLICSTQANANTVKSAIDTFIASKPRFAEDAPVTVLISEDGLTWRVVGSLRFVLDSDALLTRTEIRNRWTSGNLSGRILTGSSASYHLCSHGDVAEENCREGVLSLYNEAVK